jgi:hypothetical protein
MAARLPSLLFLAAVVALTLLASLLTSSATRF